MYLLLHRLQDIQNTRDCGDVRQQLAIGDIQIGRESGVGLPIGLNHIPHSEVVCVDGVLVHLLSLDSYKVVATFFPFPSF